ncbi:MAG: c-type cytochrome [Acidobacteria bacterium]|nr:MAG: c-type cytochrome [Acidobacteriota bacterium]
MNFIRAALIILCLAVGFILVIKQTSAQNPSAPQGVAPAEKTAEQVYKNIQLFKGLPESQFLPVMNFMNASLGVRCDFCHVNKDGNWDYVSDEKAGKKTARKMIEMTGGINKNVFEGNPEVSCYTCHRGRTSVSHTLAMPLPTPEPRPSQPAPSRGPQTGNPTADQVLEKYYQALGGAAAIDNLKSRVMKGTMTTLAGLDLGYEITQSGSELVLATITTPQAGVVQRGFDGNRGWEKNAREIRDLGTDEIFYLRRYPDIYRDIRLKGQFSRITFGGKPKIDGRDVYLLRGTNSSGKRESLFFDVETGLLVRRTTSTITPVGTIPEQIDFSDYRSVDGIMMPFTIRVSAIDSNYSVVRKFTEIKTNLPRASRRQMLVLGPHASSRAR